MEDDEIDLAEAQPSKPAERREYTTLALELDLADLREIQDGLARVSPGKTSPLAERVDFAIERLQHNWLFGYPRCI